MPKLVNLPNGSQGSFPDNMDWEEIQSIIQKQFPPESKMVENQQSPQSFQKKAATFAQKNINEPVENLLGQADAASAGFLQGIANIGPGIYNLGAKGANLIPGINIEEKKGYNFAPKNANAMAGEIASFFGPGLLGKIPQIASIPKHVYDIPQIANALKKASNIIGKSPIAIQKALKTGESIGSNALLGAVMSPEHQGLGAVLGAGGAAVGEGIGYAAPKIANKLGIGGQPGSKTIEGLEYSDIAPSVEASERLGTPLTPAEAAKDPFIGGMQGRYTRTQEAAKENVKLGMDRLSSEKRTINELLDTVYDKSELSNNKIRDLYRKAYQWNMKPEIVNELKTSDPVIAEAFENVLSDTAFQRKLKGIPENNYAFLDKVRKSILDNESKLIKSGEKSKAAEYTEARKNLVDMMDQAVPDYAKARSEAQKSIIRSQVEKKLGTSEISGKNFFNKIIRNENKYNELHSSLKNVPEAQAMLSDMKDAWHSLINVEKPSTASYQAEKAISQARGSMQFLVEKWKQVTGKKENVEAIKFIKSDKWVKQLRDAKKSSDKDRLNNTLSDIMGKLFPGGITDISEGKEE